MGFYFVVYTFLGVVAASANILTMHGRANPTTVPIWVHRVGPHFVLFTMGVCVVALITSIVNHGIVWAAVSLAEVALGFVVAWFVPVGLRLILVLTSPVSMAIILGALWKFWYL